MCVETTPSSVAMVLVLQHAMGTSYSQNVLMGNSTSVRYPERPCRESDQVCSTVVRMSHKTTTSRSSAAVSKKLGRVTSRRCDYCGRGARSNPSLAAHYIRRHWPEVRARQRGRGPVAGGGRSLQERIGLLDTRIIPLHKPLIPAGQPSVRTGVKTSTEACEPGGTLEPKVEINKQDKRSYPILLHPRTERKILPKEIKMDVNLTQNQNSTTIEIEVITLSDDDGDVKGSIQTNNSSELEPSEPQGQAAKDNIAYNVEQVFMDENGRVWTLGMGVCEFKPAPEEGPMGLKACADNKDTFNF
jgi:hypothetical protein